MVVLEGVNRFRNPMRRLMQINDLQGCFGG